MKGKNDEQQHTQGEHRMQTENTMMEQIKLFYDEILLLRKIEGPLLSYCENERMTKDEQTIARSRINQLVTIRWLKIHQALDHRDKSLDG